MDVRFWGTRFDCGTGAHGLGHALTTAGERPCNGHLMISFETISEERRRSTRSSPRSSRRRRPLSQCYARPPREATLPDSARRHT